jgi:hypothetical protein
MSVGPRGSLAGVVPAPAGSPEEIGRLRRRAFVEHGVAMIHLAEVQDPWTKQAVINEARRQLEHKAEDAPALAAGRKARR